MSTSGPLLPIKCAQCDGNEPYEPSARIKHYLMLIRLQQSGYPFGKDDLEYEEWLGLGEMKQALEKVDA